MRGAGEKKKGSGHDLLFEISRLRVGAGVRPKPSLTQRIDRCGL